MVSASWKRDLASGLIVLMPLLVTFAVVLWLYRRLASVPIPVADPTLRVLLALVVFVLLVFSTGYLMRTAVGDFVEALIDDVMNQLPGLRVVYNASKMAVETALSGTEDLQTPVKLETWGGMRMTAFKTGKKAPDGRDILFLPTAPNITTGFVIEVESEKYEELDERVEDALTRILSAGFGDTGQEEVSLLFDADESEEETPGEPQVPAEAGRTEPQPHGHGGAGETE